MCGRYSLEFDEGFYKRFQTANKIKFESHYNIAPSKINPVIVAHSPNHIEMMTWGLVPFWEEKKEKPHGLINMRDDTILTKPWAHKYIQFQRCLVPATGFYEWKKTSDGKIPYYFHLKNQKYFSFAGLYSTHKNFVGKEISSYSIITTTPNKKMSPIHNRMPVILDEEEEKKWLNQDMVEIEEIKSLINPYKIEGFELKSISTLVNNPANDDISVIETHS